MGKEHAAALKAMALCRALSAVELDAIAAIVETREIAAGGELFREGDPGDGLYLIVAGEVNVFKRSPGGEHSLAKLGAGGVLGEMSLVTSEARSATGRALIDTRVLYLPAARFRALLEAGAIAAHKIVAAIAEVLARRLATMNGVVLGLAGAAGASGSPRGALKTQDLAALHRTMQVWSF
ncbi:MAG TPA: cyclic nucleotide-binding domain-containing protein [Burkholderiales bacterium]|nr:cyclic nucleotide-binding domain-containing protein [Burkholderiales bacterium]